MKVRTIHEATEVPYEKLGGVIYNLGGRIPMAELCEMVGVSQKHLFAVLNNQAPASPTLLFKLLDVLDISITFNLRREET